MSIPVVWMEGVPGTWWDQGLVELALKGLLWHQQDGYQFQLDVPHQRAVEAGGAVVMVPGRFWTNRVAELNLYLDQLNWALTIVTTDEESLFPVVQVRQDATHRLWVMTPRPDSIHLADPAPELLGEGYAPDTRDAMEQLEHDVPTKLWDVLFAGQVTHDRRTAAVAAIRALDVSHAVYPSDGFAQGLPRAAYLQELMATKVAPAPGGPATPDSFRLYEALEAHAVPIADDFPALKGYPPGYWDMVLPGHPFPVIRDWRELPKYVDAILDEWPRSGNRCAAWWMEHKRDLVASLHHDVAQLAELPRPVAPDVDGTITVLVPTSPIPSHPSTHIVEQVIDSVRHHLPGAEVIIGADGVRPEQEHLREGYEEYLRRLLWLADHHWGNVLVQLHDEHVHQANVTRRALEAVRTPLLLFVEHDTPVWPESIDWTNLAHAIRCGAANLVRFHHEAHVLPVHQHMMLDREPLEVAGAPLLRTVQWSQRPHLASAAYYRTLLDAWFPPTSRTMIEDRMHGIVHNAYREHGLTGWEQHRLWMYAPPGDIKRSGHLDGREQEPKFDMRFQ